MNHSVSIVSIADLACRNFGVAIKGLATCLSRYKIVSNEIVLLDNQISSINTHTKKYKNAPKSSYETKHIEQEINTDKECSVNEDSDSDIDIQIE